MNLGPVLAAGRPHLGCSVGQCEQARHRPETPSIDPTAGTHSRLWDSVRCPCAPAPPRARTNIVHSNAVQEVVTRHRIKRVLRGHIWQARCRDLNDHITSLRFCEPKLV